MAIQSYWGSNPVTTTVSASPTPTSTVFTVADITEFLEDQYIQVEVSSAFERVQIQSISGSQITLASALSGAPDVPGSVKSGRTLLTNGDLNLSGALHADTTAELEALSVSNAPDKIRYYVPDYGTYHLDKGSSETADGNLVLTATTGRWIQNPTVAGDTRVRIEKSSHGFAVKDVIRHNGSTWVDARANTIANATCVWVVAEVVDTDNFIAVKKGRVTVPSHGLTAGTLYYLSHTSAGSITSTKPVGTITSRVDLYLPVIYVESSTVLHILGQDFPTLNHEVINDEASSSNVSSYAITAIDYDEMGPFRLEFNCRLSGSVAFHLRPNNDTSSGNYKHQRTEFDGATITGTDSHSPAYEIGDSVSTGAMLTVDVSKRVSGTYHLQYHLTSEEPRDYRGTLIWTPTSNMTSLYIAAGSSNLYSARTRVYRKDR